MLWRKCMPQSFSGQETRFVSVVVLMVLLHTAASDNCPVTASPFALLPLPDLMFTQHVLSEGSSSSDIDCARQCGDAEGCVMFTFQRSEKDASGRCRAYGQVQDATQNHEVLPGARNYVALWHCPSGYCRSCGSCLKAQPTTQSYTGAILACDLFYQGQLVLTKTVPELECIAHFAVINGITQLSWVGADDKTVEGEYRWRDHTPLLVDSSLWLPGQPDNASSSEDCICVQPSSHRLHDTLCGVARPFLCQTDYL